MSQNICNICGANYEYRNGRWKCPACGAFKAEELSNEEVTLLYNAAQKLRLCDFDEAEKAYTDIIEKFPKNPNGYWGRLLSKYGIKYEEDFDGRKIPTCYATSIESVIADKNYLMAMELADADTKAYYQTQAEYIERVRKEWVEKAKKEKPYDIFICYKDSDLANGIDRTPDSIAVQELYIHLTKQGYRVFFSRESLRDKVGEKYEPYIFNALSTAKVMLVYGSKPEYITSSWLKNEWTRYEKRLRAGEKKPNSLLVACDGFSPNELPKTLSSKQCFDASKPSFYSDLDSILKGFIKGEKKSIVHNPEKKKSNTKKAIIGLAIGIMLIFASMISLYLLGNNASSTITDSKHGVVIEASDKVFDKNASLIVDKLSDGVQYRTLLSSVNTSKSIDLQNAIIYDIECGTDLVDNVTIKVPYTKSNSTATVKVYYVSDDKNTIEEHNCTYNNGMVEFKTNHLSYYIVGEIINAANGNSTTIESIGVRTITFSDKFTAEYVLASWESGTKTEASMIEIMDEYGAQQGGGKLHIITPGDYIKEVDKWCFSPERKAGDYAIIQNAYGYSLCYISSINPDENLDEANKKATISFNANGGNGTMTNQPVTVGVQSILNKCTFTRDGYTFDGWATSSGGTITYTDGAMITIDTETTVSLYAVWTPLHQHDYKIINTVQANCTTAGTKTYECEGCHDTYSETIDPLTHDYKVVASQEPTCQNEGYATYKCSRCSDEYTETQGKKSHDVVLSSKTDSTCTAVGQNNYSCKNCTYTYSEEIAKKSHNYSEATCTTPKTCETCGKTEGQKLGHSDTLVCTRCGEPTIETVVYEGKGNQYFRNIAFPAGKYNVVLTLGDSKGYDSLSLWMHDGTTDHYIGGVGQNKTEFKTYVITTGFSNGYISVEAPSDATWTIEFIPISN